VLKEESNITLIIQLLEQKNDLLRLFLEISENERRSFKARNFENLELLYISREELLDNIQSLDQRLERYSALEEPRSLSGEEKNKIQKMLAQKQLLVNEILAQDLVILSCVESEKSGMIKKISSVRSGRRLMKAYRRLPDIVE
jgi:hypothetical protein